VGDYVESGEKMNFGFYRQEDDNNKIRWITRWVVDILVVIILAIFLGRYLGENYTQIGHAMEPACASGDVFLIDKISYHLSKPDRFDIIVFHKETDEQKTYMKRIIGLPGETVQIRNGIVYINDEELDSYNITGITAAGLATNPITLKSDEYFVLGDNADSSEDSRFADVGNVKESQIIGRIWFRLKPLDAIGFMKWEEG
jgi:signal peptidase I